MLPIVDLEMSNTGRNKKLASFNCDENLWIEFKHRCQDSGTTATAILTHFIQLYLDGSLDNLDVNPLDKRFDERVKASVDEYLATRLDPLQTKMAALSEKVAFLEGTAIARSAPREAITTQWVWSKVVGRNNRKPYCGSLAR